MDAKADANANGGGLNKITPISIAADSGNEEYVRLLLDAKANVHLAGDRSEYNLMENGTTPLERAQANGHEHIVKLLQKEILKNPAGGQRQAPLKNPAGRQSQEEEQL